VNALSRCSNRHDLVGEQAHIQFGFVMRQSAIAELANKVIETVY